MGGRRRRAKAALGFGDVGAAPAWRNLRAPLTAIPADATQVRLVVTDDDLAPQHWIAVTPPRIPQLRTLQDVVGSQDPVLLDWLVGLAFPCQRPFDHQNGVIEVPKWRILPDRFGAEANSPVMDNVGGGPLGISELLLRAITVPTYLKNDWFRDWGALQQLITYYPNAAAGAAGSRNRDPKRAVEPRAAAPDTVAAPVCLAARRPASSASPTSTLVPRDRGSDRPDGRSPPSRESPDSCCAGLVPLLPVKQTTATVLWPQAPGPTE